MAKYTENSPIQLRPLILDCLNIKAITQKRPADNGGRVRKG